MISQAILTLMLFTIGSLCLSLGPVAGLVCIPWFYMAFWMLKLFIDELFYKLKFIALRTLSFFYKFIKLS